VARHSGDDLALQVASAEGGPYASMGCFTQLAVNATRDRFEVTCGGDANKTYVLGKKDFTVTGTMVWDDTNDEVWEAADSDTPLYYRVIPDLTDNPSWYWQGQFYIDVSMDIPVAGAVTSGVNLAAAGSITHLRA
jgi:hypothetical protein